MTDIDKRIAYYDEFCKEVQFTENNRKDTAKQKALSYYGEADVKKFIHSVFVAQEIITHLQAQLVEREEVIDVLANLSGQLHALVTCTEYSESFRIFEANIIQQQIKAALTKTEEK